MRLFFVIVITASSVAAFSLTARASDFPVSEDREQGRSIPQILSGDEARRAAVELTGGQPEGQAPPEAVVTQTENQVRPKELVEPVNVAGPASAPKPKTAHEFTDAELGPPPSEGKMKEMVEGLRGKDALFDPDKVEQLRLKVEAAIQNSPPEQKEKLLNLRRQVDETVKRVMLARQAQGAQGGGGQPFGPDSGRRPKDSKTMEAMKSE